MTFAEEVKKTEKVRYSSRREYGFTPVPWFRSHCRRERLNLGNMLLCLVSRRRRSSVRNSINSQELWAAHGAERAHLGDPPEPMAGGDSVAEVDMSSATTVHCVMGL